MRLIKQGPSALAIAGKRGGKGGVIAPDKPKNAEKNLGKKGKTSKKPTNFEKKYLQK